MKQDNPEFRLKLILEKIAKAKKENEDIIIMMDTNIDTSVNSTRNTKYKPKMLKIFEDFLQNNNLQILNEEFTRFQSGVNPSCIDHIITNNPERMKRTQTITNVISDHETVVSEYHNSSMVIRTAERVVRNSKNLTVENLEREFDNNVKLNTINEKDDPDEIANIIQEELTTIIDKLTHPRIVQVKKKNNPTLSKETRKMMEMNKKNLTKAKKSQSKKDWIEYRRNRNIIADMVNKDKDKKIEKSLEDGKERWNILKNICNKEEFEIPKEIRTKTGVERKPRLLANLANNHYIEKIKKIMMEMPKTTTTPMKILKKLIPRQEKTMKFNLISLEKTKKIIQKLPNTASHGYDPITNKTIKKIKTRMTPVIAPLINVIIKTEKFPKILNKMRITLYLLSYISFISLIS